MVERMEIKEPLVYQGNGLKGLRVWWSSNCYGQKFRAFVKKHGRLDGHIQLCWVPITNGLRKENDKPLKDLDLSIWEKNRGFAAKYDPAKGLLWHVLQTALIKVKERMYHNT